MTSRSKRSTGFTEYSFVSRERQRPAARGDGDRPSHDTPVPSMRRFPQAEAVLAHEAKLERAKPPSRFAAGQIIATRYQLEESIGRGGMGEVWAVYDRRIGRRLALKLVDLTAGDATTAPGRFAREAGLLRQLRGRAFVEVFDHGFASNRAYIAMELLDGESLLDRMRRLGQLTPSEALFLLRGIAEGLRVAHALQIVHRDLKPSNVFFARPAPTASGVLPIEGTQEVVKLLDFGIAKDTWDAARLTRPDTLLGSASYMSPEQIQCGRDVDTRSDLWSLAVILYRAITGQRPFAGSGGEVLAQILNQDVPPASKVNPRLPGTVDAFFEKALAKDAAERFSTVDELLAAFAKIFEGSKSTDRDDDARRSFSSLETVEVDVSELQVDGGPDDDVFDRETLVQHIDVARAFAQPPPRPARAVRPQRAERAERPSDRPTQPPPRPGAPVAPPLDSKAAAAALAPPKPLRSFDGVFTQMPPEIARRAAAAAEARAAATPEPAPRSSDELVQPVRQRHSAGVLFAVAVLVGLTIGVTMLSTRWFGVLVEALKSLFG
ncbi:MAG: serine/threonine protein kinase [Polyangiaceae bacterium]|nr:serine/threonine protein kinase [Polyangiaceae bacterium]